MTQKRKHGTWIILLGVLLGVSFFFESSDAYAQTRKSRFRKGSQVRTRTTKRPSRKSHNYVKEDGKTVVYRKRNVVDFDDALIEGDVRNPSEFYFVHRPEEKFGSLVKKRKNFHKEMLRDTVMIR